MEKTEHVKMSEEGLLKEINMKAKIGIDLMGPDFLGLDIETFPHLGYSWVEQVFGRNWNFVGEIVERGYIMSVGIKRGKQKTVIFSIHDHRGSLYNREKAMLKRVHKELDSADIVYGYNSDKFDIKKLNAKFLEYGWAPYSPTRQVDLMKEWNKLAKDGSSKLDNVLKRLGYAPKLEHEGFALWLGYHAGVPKDIRKFDRYCKRDVEGTFELLVHLLPWMKNAPNGNWWSRSIKACSNPACGQTKTLIKKGTYPAGQRRKQIYLCSPSRGGCGKHCHGELIPQDPNLKLIITK